MLQVKTWCNVIYRKFDFSKFPEHFKDLRVFAWKPLIIQVGEREGLCECHQLNIY